jgi:hypothetical protein
VGYRQPRRINTVTIVMILVLGAAAYWMWVFFPTYWDAWTVDHELREGASALYKLNNLAEPQRQIEMRKVLKDVQSRAIKRANITDPEFDVEMEIEGDLLILTATYEVKIKHPVGNWITTLKMNRVQKANVKRVNWD